MKKPSKQVRVDPEFEDWTKEIAIERVKRNLEKELLPPREITRMMLNAPGLEALEIDLITKPRKKI